MATPGGFTPKKPVGVTSIDSLVTSFGGCGPFQIKLVTATYAAQLCAVWSMMFMAFGNYHTSWWCYTGSHVAVNGNDEVMEYSKLAPNRTIAQTTTPSSKKNSSNLGSCGTMDTCADVVFDSEASTIVSEWGLICEKAWIQSVIICVQMAGVCFGSYLGGFFADRFGRKITLYAKVLAHAVINVIIIFSPTWEMFTILRFLIGICIGGILSCCIVYPIEFVSQWWRGVLGALPVWNVGAASFSVAVLLLKDWRYLHIGAAVISVLVFIPVFWVPESPRWLAVHGQVDRAKEVANRVAETNKKPPPNTTVLEIIAREERRKSRRKSNHQAQHIAHQYSFFDLFNDSYFRTLSIKMGIIWACMSMVYYAITFGVKFFSGNFYINLIIFSIAEIPGMAFVAPASNRLGRRLSSFVYFLFIAVACLAVVVVTFVATDDIQGTAITVLALLAKMHILAVWMIVTVYCSELYPTVIRNLSIGYLNSCARIGGIVAPYLIPNMLGFVYIMFLVMGIALLACCVLLISLPETKGRPLEDTLRSRSQLSVIVEETEIELRISESA